MKAPNRHDYFASRQRKLEAQFDANRTLRTSTIFSGVVAAVNGHTPELSALEIKQIMSEHGGVYATNVWTPGVTHLICSNLPTAKVRKELDTTRRKPLHILTANWIVESLKAGHQLPVQNYVLSQLKNHQQGTLSAWCRSMPDSHTATTTTNSNGASKASELVLIRMVEDAVMLDAAKRSKTNLNSTLCLVVHPESNQVMCQSSTTKKYVNIGVGSSAALVEDAVVKKIAYHVGDGVHASLEFLSIVREKLVLLVNSTTCVVPFGAHSLLVKQLEQHFSCGVETKMWTNSDVPSSIDVATDKVEDRELQGISVEIVFRNKHDNIPLRLIQRLETRKAVWAWRFSSLRLEYKDQSTTSVLNLNTQSIIEESICMACSQIDTAMLNPGDWIRIVLTGTKDIEFDDEAGVEADNSRHAFPEKFSDIDLHVFRELPLDIQQDIQTKFELDQEKEESIRCAFPQSFSQVDPRVLRELPDSVVEEVQSEFELRLKRNKPLPLQESFSAIREHFLTWIAAIPCANEQDLFFQTCTDYVSSNLFRARELVLATQFLGLMERVCSERICSRINCVSKETCWKDASLRVREHVLLDFKLLFGRELQLL